MTRVQELGRLCRYPAVNSAMTLPAFQAVGASQQITVAQLEEQLTAAFHFARGASATIPTVLDLQVCHDIALSFSAEAHDVYAYESWMSSVRSRRTIPQHRDKLLELACRLEEKVRTFVSVKFA